MLYMVLEDEDIRTKLRVVGPLSHWIVGGINYTHATDTRQGDTILRGAHGDGLEDDNESEGSKRDAEEC